MEKQQVLHKGQVARGYLRAGTQILVQRGRLFIQYTPHYMGACLPAQTQVLLEGELELTVEAGWLSLTGDGVEILIIDPVPARCWILKIQELLPGFKGLKAYKKS
ncbi:hypothetical protein [Iodobacter ciconiae]|uniref:Uncharacterized protein n=1 Tax=Iodobacter ciconiae TaxID=2496266 RepID=A0A3S8ZT61_9NEIS|nr:hypothetical protein [Iodobacter ciconiae]AZN36693.1 hypothetical protein EJO50_09440 [Iodobacter ciconiae]